MLDQSDNDAPTALHNRPLPEIVHELWTLNRDWDRVLSEEDRGLVEIDDDEAPQTRDERLRFVNITAIVPNWVNCGFKALQLAKIWWTTASRVYGDRRPSTGNQGRTRNDEIYFPDSAKHDKQE